MHKIFFTLSSTEFNKLKIINYFENIIYTYKERHWEIEIFSPNHKEDKTLLKDLFRIRKISTIPLKKKKWDLENNQTNVDVSTELFTFSSLKKSKVNKKRYSVKLHNTFAFGTGKHESTFLAIKNIELILKKKKIKKCCDIGTGTGILSFVLRKKIMKPIIATDIDINSEKSFYINKKFNQLNGIRFLRCRDFRSKELYGKTFDLILSNILLNDIKNLSLKFRKFLKLNGILIISGILIHQVNDLIIIFKMINLKLIKRTFMNDWASLIFIRK